jgi:Holliday junction resolvasome RuvABC endonuclease subunit
VECKRRKSCEQQVHCRPGGCHKRHVTGKGNADKAAVIAAVRSRGFDPADDNEADALAILPWAIETQGGVR